MVPPVQQTRWEELCVVLVVALCEETRRADHNLAHAEAMAGDVRRLMVEQSKPEKKRRTMWDAPDENS